MTGLFWRCCSKDDFILVSRIQQCSYHILLWPHNSGEVAVWMDNGGKRNEIANLKSVDKAAKLQQHSTTETDLWPIGNYFFFSYFQPRPSIRGVSMLNLIVGATENRSLSANQDAELYDFVRQIEICIHSNPSVTIETNFHSSREGTKRLDCAACFCNQTGWLSKRLLLFFD